MNPVNSRNDFGHDDSAMNIVMAIIIIKTVTYKYQLSLIDMRDKIVRSTG